jgi:perosamine synthetase
MKVIFNPDEIQEAVTNVANVLQSGYLIKGLYSDAFAGRVALRCSKDCAALFSSDTAAMEMLFKALRVDGRYVAFQGNMFPSPVFACMRAGGKPLYVDMELSYLGVSTGSLVEQIQEKDVAVVVMMHTAGIVSRQVTEIAKICTERGIVLIEDCAHAYGARLWNGSDHLSNGAGSWGDFAVFSFYATKPMNCGEGGAIATNVNRIDVLNEVESLARYGKKELFGAPWCVLPGYSNRMTEILCAIGVAADNFVDGKIGRRREIADIYNDHLGGIVQLYGGVPGSNYYKYVVLSWSPTFDRGAFKARMKDEYGIGIPAGVYDFPVYVQPPLLGTAPKPLQNTELFCGNHICLPMHEGLSDDDATYVAEAAKEVLG